MDHDDEHEARLRAELIANVSHDLRMPLVAMRGYLELLARSDETLPSDERRSYLAIALRQCEQLGRLVDELSELARLDSRGVRLARERFAVAELASDVVRKFALAAERRGVELAAIAVERLPLVDADLGLIERVLDNLIDNALRHTPPGGAVRIAIDRGDGVVRVRVRDTGAGIAADELPHVFDRHWRGAGSAARAGGGLGLAIAQRILALHGGRIDVESELARGSCFSFSLPAAEPAR
jgi:signal transduction histidine kinase|nr:HAMP domain-containing sensor histidine kinase [Caldimonas sp.]